MARRIRTHHILIKTAITIMVNRDMTDMDLSPRIVIIALYRYFFLSEQVFSRQSANEAKLLNNFLDPPVVSTVQSAFGDPEF